MHSSTFHKSTRILARSNLATSFDVIELMRQKLPAYAVNCLLAAGYDVIEVI